MPKPTVSQEDYSEIVEKALKLLESGEISPTPDFFKISPTPDFFATQCAHPNAKMPEFDAQVAKGLSSSEVRQRWPRKSVYCPDCKETFIAYASFEHYIAGDW